MTPKGDKRTKKQVHFETQASNYHVFTKKETINFGKSKI